MIASCELAPIAARGTPVGEGTDAGAIGIPGQTARASGAKSRGHVGFIGNELVRAPLVFRHAQTRRGIVRKADTTRARQE